MHKILQFTIEQTTLGKDELQELILGLDNVVSVINLKKVRLEGTVNEFEVRIEVDTNASGSVEEIPSGLEGVENIILVDKEDVTLSDP